MRIAGYVKNSIVDGPGIRFTLFVQGCVHHCEGCHNPETWNIHGGKEMSVDEVYALIEDTRGITGLTISGGEPMCQAEECLELLRKCKEELGLNVWVYTGYYVYQLEDEAMKALADEADAVVDGPFMIGLKTYDQPFKGSSNQRILVK